MKYLRWCFAAVLAVAALYLLALGGQLALLGGSVYYVLMGLAYLLAAFWMARQKRLSAYVIIGALIVTIVWSFVEVGTQYWGWLPRLLAPLGFAIVAALMFSSLKEIFGKAMLATAVVGVIAFAGFFARGFMNIPYVSNGDASSYEIAESDNAPLNWTAYSRDTMGTRYSPFTQINRDNVKSLELAWTFETGRDQSDIWKVDQNTPLQIGNTLYACTPENIVHAINATTGEGIWSYDAQATGRGFLRCRGLGYFEDTTTADGDVCHERIIGNTIDARLYALDAATGELCQDFGVRGEINLLDNMFETGDQYYYQTSAPSLPATRSSLAAGSPTTSRSTNPRAPSAPSTCAPATCSGPGIRALPK